MLRVLKLNFNLESKQIEQTKAYLKQSRGRKPEKPAARTVFQMPCKIFTAKGHNKNKHRYL